MADPRSSYAYQQAAARYWELNPNPVCWLCLLPIDMSLRSPHPMSKSIDHYHPLQHGGSLLDLSNFRASHRTCNVSRGNRTRKQRPPTNPSRRW